MDTATIHSRSASGIDAPPVRVEVHISGGLPGLHIVGLPETAVRESKDRVRSALLNTQFLYPQQRITVNLAPADLPKEGSRFDLPIALGILGASGQIPLEKLDSHEFIGEVALTGELRSVRGALPVALAAASSGRTLIVPSGNAAEVALVRGARCYAATGLPQVAGYLCGTGELSGCPFTRPEPAATETLDLCDVRGQAAARRVLEIAAAGRHNLLMIGPPGTGKSMLASRIVTILPEMTEAEALEAAAVQSIAHGSVDPRLWRRRPYRAPHHTASAVALVGGGSHPRPGEISLAHHGVLFLDELPEFDRRVLEALREPLETGEVTVSRAARQATFPAQIQLLAAMNPCPCGFHGASHRQCRCTPAQIERYRQTISGPLLDRIDLQIEVPALPPGALMRQQPDAESSATVRRRIEAAHRLQMQRQGRPNAGLGIRDLDRVAALDHESSRLLVAAVERLGLSARALHRIRRVARTIGDLEGSPRLTAGHVAEALSYRRFDRPGTSTP
jgi:magnesium chelatase family protein